MAIHTIPQHSQRGDPLLLLAFYVAELAFVLAALSLYKKGDRSLSTWMSSTPGIAFCVAIILLIGALTWLCIQWIRRRNSGSRWFALMMAMNIITVGLMVIPFEVAIRLLARDTPDGKAVFQTVLLPRSWDKATTHYRQVLQKASGDLSYLIYNDSLGWTVGPSRRSGNGLYFSSVEGLRAEHQGDVLKGPSHKVRVALLGDSFAFGEGVKLEDSWGHLLENNVGGAIQVLNFGVPGYGVDQAYLRFREDALAWKPDVAILAFPRSDLYRTITVYPFVNWPEWDMPFSKPRFVRNSGALTTLNVPTIPPEKMFAMTSVSGLPFLEYDLGYRKSDWSHTVADLSYAYRWLTSYLSPPVDEKNPYTSGEETIQLNAAVLREFARLADQHGVVPLVVYYPPRVDFARHARGEETDANAVLKLAGVPFVDATPCVIAVGSADLAYLVGDPHYSARGNAAVAECVGGALGRLLESQQALKRAAQASDSMRPSDARFQNQL
jgi:hypothetical protein